MICASVVADLVDCQANKRNGNSSAWPVANPVISCASVTDVGYPSNFVADPFLFIQVPCTICYGLLDVVFVFTFGI